MLARLLSSIPRLILRLFAVVGLALFLMFGLRFSTPPLGEPWTAIGILARDYQFDYVTWELNALAVKAVQTLYGLHPYMTEEARSQYVRDYMADLGHAQALENRISRIYADPDIDDPDQASLELRAERDALRADLNRRQALAEAILEGQVARVLVDEGFGFYGQLLPPISAHFTQVPNLLVVSPRDRISFDIAINLNPMPVDAQIALEEQIDRAHDVSSLIVPLGGIALYPSMILETSSIPYAIEVFAHEWLHHYLLVFPLGFSYDFAGEARIINETTANLFGREIAPLVLQRYYPELAPRPPEQPETDDIAVAPAPPASPPRFDFGMAMHETRVRVDELLAEGKVEEAEAYMEERRELFVANGYHLRKLNQAFFAFYGGYQSGTPGEGGSDPIGPAVQAIRDASPSIHDWIVTMRTIVSRDQLLAVRDRLAPEA
ncbi:MAG: hypothetical protein DIU68_007725 [Chloroflexota bacterium]|nr:MAG: hypothetical protein DIU68_14480 [Chloroflexota bacterium]